MSDKKLNHAKDQAISQLQSIQEMVATLNKARHSDDEHAADEARRIITEDALSVDVRGRWQAVGDRLRVEEYRILLCTGGPAVQITGELDRWNQPHTACLQYQDWFTPWTDLEITVSDEETVLEYCREFYFGET